MQTIEYTNELVNAGLAKDQALVYETMLRIGEQPASRIARELPLSRTLVYKVLDELIEKGLAEKKDEKGAIATFKPKHPFALRDYVRNEERRFEQTKAALDTIIPSLTSQFATVMGQPGLRIIPGADGVQELYKDILNESKDILLIRSPLDDSHPELMTMVDKQIEAQVRKNIHVRAITPLMPETPKSILEHDEKNLVERRIISKEKLDIPAQIIIYGSKAALTSYEEPMMTTIIENNAITTTLRLMFEYIWSASAEEDRLIRSKILSETFKRSAT